MLSATDRALKARRKALQRLRVLAWIGGLLVAVGAIFVSGRIGVEMARNRLPEKKSSEPKTSGAEVIRVGRVGDPVYLAQTPESLRRFFAAHPTSEDRSSANLSGLGIRRLQDSIDLTPLRTEADAIEVKVASGAIAGAVYWIHHSQLPAPAGFDPIISPVPGSVVPAAPVAPGPLR
jgi:hypothetical protein